MSAAGQEHPGRRAARGLRPGCVPALWEDRMSQASASNLVRPTLKIKRVQPPAPKRQEIQPQGKSCHPAPLVSQGIEARVLYTSHTPALPFLGVLWRFPGQPQTFHPPASASRVCRRSLEAWSAAPAVLGQDPGPRPCWASLGLGLRVISSHSQAARTGDLLSPSSSPRSALTRWAWRAGGAQEMLARGRMRGWAGGGSASPGGR